MSYSRPPVQPGRGLTRTPALPAATTAGVLEFAFDADIATTTSLGVVQVGTGLSITPAGVLSAIGSSGNFFVNVTLTNVDYTATATDSYVGATSNNITITLPFGILGRVYYVKNQSSGNIRVQGSGAESINGNTFQTLGSNGGFMVVFDGARWNIVG